ncbi:MgtC/SapB family protein [Streptococcus merionis]|uniref:Putative Mg2+ transporter-C n=1 Tax=Streptococcus merionis TaxID=400065 RepID=A0A239STY0_9STRE|nr:MgtC/SapB family protein [Streptococcus merionis]SNU88709.1 putative Mg2+ transporter-C [Streptococcus merionis]
MIDQLTLVDIAIRSLLAVLVGGFIGLERGGKNQPAGIRTHSLVCLGACVIMMTNLFVSIEFQVGDPTRMGAQVVNGIGFLGAGTILVTNDNKVRGLTTAAGVWVAAAIGLAIGIGFYRGALISFGFVWGVMTLFQPMKAYIQKRSKVMDLYLVFDSMESYNRVLIYFAENRISISESKVSFGEVSKSKLKYFDVEDKQIASYLTIELKDSFEHLKTMEELSLIPGVLYVEEL